MDNFFGDYFAYENGSVTSYSKLNPNTNEHDLWVKPTYSIVSKGTERWQLNQINRAFQAGYISVGGEGSIILSPTPHGAYFLRESPDNLIAQQTLSIQQLCLARFQMVAGYALTTSTINLNQFDEVDVIGGGPIAIGAALEFLQHSYKVTLHVKEGSFLTKYTNEYFNVTDSCNYKYSRLLIDCTGRSDTIDFLIDKVAPGTVIGILGSPREKSNVDLYAVHRNGLSIVGLHELLDYSPTKRQAIFHRICEWHEAAQINFHDPYFKILSGEKFEEMVTQLVAEKLKEPFLILKW